MSAKTNIAKLPEECFGILPAGGDIILIRSGESGYYKCNPAEAREDWVNDLNKRAGVSRQQRSAMEQGSMFGWHIPAADPDHKINNR